MTTCAECGKENDTGVEVCVGCGARLEPTEVRSVIGSLVLGVYRIVEVLGQGGMSVVYKAQHRMTGHTVALKILPEEIAVHEDIKARFIEEAKALAQLEHPGIVRLNHFGEERGRFVLVMQYVEGKTFEKVIFQANRLPWRLAADVMLQVLDALAYAHGRGVVHRDIKPSNIFVRTDGTAMLMDFGIAKMREGSSRLTATGQTMGTVRYMSPEQVRGKVVDARTDIYSVGVALYEALTGDTPFDGQTHFEIMMKHLQEPPPPLSARGVSPPDAVGKAIAAAMTKDVAKRPQNAAELAQKLASAFGSEDERRRAHEELGALVRGQTIPLDLRPAAVQDGQSVPVSAASGASLTDLADKLEPEPARPGRARWTGWAAIAAALAVAAVGVVVFVRRPGGDAGPPRGVDIPAPLLVTGLSPIVDVTFGAPDYLRVVATRQIDAQHLRRSFAQARRRFEDFLRAKKIGGAVEVHPVTLVVAPAAVLCHRDLYDKGAAPADCAERPPRFKYPIKRSTLYVNDNENLDEVNLVEGAAVHFCSTSAALLELGCGKNILPPFWDDVEKVIR
jgi:serine/threonine protein kinase